MKRFNIYAYRLFLTGLFSVLMMAAAYAQHGGQHGGHAGGQHGGQQHGGIRGGQQHGGIRGGQRHGGIRPGGIGTRAGINRSLNYRGHTGYFAGRGYHGGAFFRPGFGYYGYPHLGFYLRVLPFGFYPFYWDSYLYYYYGGIFYAPYNDGGYVVTDPPVGAVVPNLPDDAQSIKIDTVQYYEFDGVYYKGGTDDKGKKIYIVAGKDGVLNTDGSAVDPNTTIALPRVGDIVNQLPDNCRKITLNGKIYYISPDDIYYEKATDPDGNTAYRIVSLPDDGKGT